MAEASQFERIEVDLIPALQVSDQQTGTVGIAVQ
jgi:hypothetical protein